MIDPIKQFVDENRDAFDHMEPPAHLLQQIQGRLKADKVEEKKTIPLFSKTKWLVAASILVAATMTFIFYNPTDKGQDQLALQTVKPADSQPAKNNTAAINTAAPVSIALSNHPKTIKTKPANLQPIKETLPTETPDTRDIYARLADSTSSSTRLAAILEIDRNNNVNNTMLDNLAKTLNHDASSNVRLAALNVMRRYSRDEHTSTLLVQSLSTQNDPLIQIGLINILGKLQNVKIDNKLFALADDPNTFTAVKDEAYALLLSQNKL